MTVSKVTEGESGRRILGVVAAARIAVVAGSIEKGGLVFDSLDTQSPFSGERTEPRVVCNPVEREFSVDVEVVVLWQEVSSVCIPGAGYSSCLPRALCTQICVPLPPSFGGRC